MNVRSLLILFCFASLVSCRKEEKKEAAPLSQDQMVEIMMKIYLAEARANAMPVSKDSAYKLFVPFQDSLLHHSGIADSTLRKAYAYYLGHPTELETVYDAIIDSLSLREQRMREQH
jgi:hypothetical protein